MRRLKACWVARALVSGVVACVVLLGAAASAFAAVAQIESLQMRAETTEATVRAVVVAGAEDVMCRLQYVSQAKFEATMFAEAASVPCTPATVAAGSSEEVIIEPSDLAVNTAYAMRFELETATKSEATTPEEFSTFGIAAFELGLLDDAEEPFTQAAGHPYELTTTIEFGNTPYYGLRSPDGNPKDVVVRLPPGLVGNPAAASKCTRFEAESFKCPASAQIGLITMALSESTNVGTQETFTEPLYNLVPPQGTAAQFGARVSNFADAFIDAKVRTGGDYGVNAESLNITTLANLISVSVKMWGVPGSPAHHGERYCRAVVARDPYEAPPCAEGEEPLPETPFLVTPASCTGPLESAATVDSYQHPGEWLERGGLVSPGMAGCGRVPFTPALAVVPGGSSSDSPSGVEVRLHVPQVEREGVVEGDLRDASVTLPAGVSVNPAAAGGMVGCPLLSGKGPHAGVVGIDLENSEPADCPDESKIGKVELETPLFPGRVFEGGIYVAQQDANPFGSLLAGYIAIDEPVTGVVVKLAGRIEAGGQPGVGGLADGQLRAVFDENPQLPFEDLRLKLFGGGRAALALPRSCGVYSASSVLEPWSHQGAAGEVGTPDADPGASFSVTSGPGGGGCPGDGFAPSLAAGTSDNHAGSYSPFSLILRRADGEPRFSTVATTMPPGLAGTIAHLALCGVSQAAAGDCPAGSQIGHVVVESGVGGELLTLPQPGRREDPVFLTGPYDGAPFGLSIVVHPEAGPFNLAEGAGTGSERPVVVRARVLVDPHTAQVSVVSDPMPTLLQGIPADVKALDVVIDREGFMFNATSCEPMAVSGTVDSDEGQAAAVSSRYQASGCRKLPFQPHFGALTHAKHGRKDGAYLHVVVKSGPGQANIAKVHVKLPKILPARESTLKQACSEEQFAKNPAGCPEGSKVGTATAYTPVLPTPLTGPAIFVSHGGAAYPDLDLVLQGDGVTVVLTGNTHINGKTGVTSSTFKSVPDIPISRFDLVLPAQPNSALGASGNLCTRKVTRRKRVRIYIKPHTNKHGKHIKGHYAHRTDKTHHRIRRKLHMPTTITGQNGAIIHKKITIAVMGCHA